MKIGWSIIYSGILIISVILSLFLTPLSEKIGRRFGLIDEPKADRFHKKTKSRSGGIAIFLSFITVVLSGLFLALLFHRRGLLLNADVSRLVPNIPAISSKILGLFIGAGFIFFVGLLDDRLGLNPWIKLFCQVLSALPLILVGIRIQMFLPPLVGVFLTVFWVVLLTNSFNFMDNMDGLSSGIAIIVSFVLALVSWQAQDRFVTAMLMAFSGSMIGFWYFNFFHSKLFMGDSGSLFIGYMIASLTIQATYYKSGVPTALPVLTPLIILGVPLFDTISVLSIRLSMQKSLMKGDTNHFSHRLVNLGMNPRQAVIFIYLVTLCVALAAMPLGYLPLGHALVQTAQVAFWFVLIFLLERAGKRKIEENQSE